MCAKDTMTCPLCSTAEAAPFHQDKRTFLRCPKCLLVFVPPRQWLTAEAEKTLYDQHNNSPDDLHYRHFLSRLFIPLQEQLAPCSTGLDFGSGPGPTLSVMFAEAGHQMSIYDIFYAPDKKVFTQHYDFITASEVVEHLHQPMQALEQLWSCLKSDAILGIMTKRVISQEAFVHWHYKNDLTHVCFFSIETFQWLANHWGASLSFPGKDVALLIKK